MCPPLPHGRNLVTLGHLELSHLEFEKHKLKTPNQMPLKRKVTIISWEPLFCGITGTPGFAENVGVFMSATSQEFHF